jgi:hypothetical protein
VEAFLRKEAAAIATGVSLRIVLCTINNLGREMMKSEWEREGAGVSGD